MPVPDLVLAIVGISTAFAGWRRGLIVSLSSFVGFVAGFALGRVLAGPVVGWVNGNANAEVVPAWVVPLAPLVVGFVVAGFGGWLGTWLRRVLHKTPGKWIDAGLGAFVGVVSFLLCVWLAATWIRTTPFVQLNRAVAESRIVAIADWIMPADPNVVVGTLDRALVDYGFPTVFKGQPERIRGIGEPNPEMVEVGKSVSGSVVKVRTDETVCDNLQSGTGWVFAPEHVATNAHVVAGSTSLTVQVNGKGKVFDAELVAFDPKRDVAVLRVPGLPVKPLDTGADLNAGADAVAVGFPGNGGYTISPARTRETLRARGADIYDDESVTRNVYSLRAIIRQGNSGGPLLDKNGRVVGMVFATSLNDKETGYALTIGEIESVLRQGRHAERPLPSGKCPMLTGK
ncbi:MarP family serine protease [Brevibacterium sp. UMB1308A]|uniref:MarP family serine protease n=1 Tax=Brevibacterium sp. UMB1308A TaxID=3050608 RepID=UPI00254C54CE|nr:MarP family serine protease [Brevibacterium sp. UMB1308A]MDK8347608.1 MarP family serine protease [Brevibacterium sp. UMB1308B]MDK8714151.1 MarP family serine protease [Brevibacterium sp. UMB1308A]